MAFDDLKKKLKPESEQMGSPAPEADPSMLESGLRGAAPEADPSMLESGLRGAAQGATFGFAPNISGAAQALPVAADALMGHANFQDILNKYKTAKAGSQQEFDAAETANPKTFLAGNLAGAAAPSLFTGGAGEGAALARLGEGGAAKALMALKAANAAKEAEAAGGVVAAAKGAIPFVGKNMAKAAPIMESEAPMLGTGAQQLERLAGSLETPQLTQKELIKQMQKIGSAEGRAAQDRANALVMAAKRKAASSFGGLRSKLTDESASLAKGSAKQALRDTLASAADEE